MPDSRKRREKPTTMAAAEYWLPNGRPSTQDHVAWTARWWATYGFGERLWMGALTMKPPMGLVKMAVADKPAEYWSPLGDPITREQAARTARAIAYYGFGMKMWKDHQAMLARQPVIMGGPNPAPVKMIVRALVDLEIIAYPERALSRRDLLEALSMDDGIVQFTEVHSIELRGNKPCPR